MKKLITIGLIILFSQNIISKNIPETINTGNQHINNNLILLMKDAKKKKVKIIVFWGNPIYGCNGFGICGIVTIEERSKKVSDNEFSTIATMEKNKRGGIQLFFADEDINQMVKKTYLGDKSIIMGNDYKIEKEIVSEIGISKTYTIKKGNYSLNKVKGGYMVSFN